MKTRQRLGIGAFVLVVVSLASTISDSSTIRLIGMLVFFVSYMLATTWIVPVLDKKDADNPHYQHHQPIRRFGILTNVFVALYITGIFGVYDVGAWRHLLLIGVFGGLFLQQRAVKKAVAYTQAHRDDTH